MTQRSHTQHSVSIFLEILQQHKMHNDKFILAERAEYNGIQCILIASHVFQY